MGALNFKLLTLALLLLKIIRFRETILTRVVVLFCFVKVISATLWIGAIRAILATNLSLCQRHSANGYSGIILSTQPYRMSTLLDPMLAYIYGLRADHYLQYRITLMVLIFMHRCWNKEIYRKNMIYQQGNSSYCVRRC